MARRQRTREGCQERGCCHPHGRRCRSGSAGGRHLRGDRCWAKDPERSQSVVYCYDGGIVDFVKHINKQKEPIHPRVIHFEGEGESRPQSGHVKRTPSKWPCSGTPATTTTCSRSPTTSTPTRAASHLSGLPGGHHPHHQRLRSLQGLPQGEGGEPQRRGCPRRPGGHRQRQAAGPSVRGPDQDQAGQLRDHAASSRAIVNQKLAEFLEENPSDGQADHQQDGAGGPRPAGGAQGPRPHPAQERAREHHPARQAGRLLHTRPRVLRALPGGGRLGRRLGQAGPRPQLPGHPAAARQDHQRREGPAQQDPLQHRDPGHHQRLRHQPGRRVRPDLRPLPQAHHHDRRRRRRGAHPHPHPHLPVPQHGGVDRRRLRLHRAAAALPGHAQAPGLLRVQRRAARATCSSASGGQASPCSASRAWAR